MIRDIPFAGKAPAACCKHCISQTHQVSDCERAPTEVASPQHLPPTQTPAAQSPSFRQSPVCYEWNHNQATVCPYRGCKCCHINLPALCSESASIRYRAQSHALPRTFPHRQLLRKYPCSLVSIRQATTQFEILHRMCARCACVSFKRMLQRRAKNELAHGL